jgi:Lrp/AsnC family transcriptional regulator
MSELDKTDLRILALLQRDCTTPVAEIGRAVGLSTTPCWRRIQKLEQEGVIERRVALLDPQRLGVGVTVFVFITAGQHSEDWLARFHAAIEELPEVVEFYRMSGQVDYLLRVVVPDIQHYDQVYKKLIAKVECKDISSSFAMEQIKFTTELPLAFAAERLTR